MAGADGAFDEERRPIAFVLRMTDIYAALEQAIPRAKPRVLSNTENDILRHRQIHAEDDNLPGMWSLYAADIINRFRENTGEIDPGNLIIEHLPSRHLYLRSFLMLGQVFPCDEHVRERLHNTKGISCMGSSEERISSYCSSLSCKQGVNSCSIR